MNGGVLIDLGRRIFVRNFYLKFIAVILTLALYIWVSEDREAVVAGHAGVQMVVPDDMVLVSEPVDRVKVTVQGRWSDINRFDITNLDPIRLDLSPGDDESVVSITRDMIGVPPSLRVTDVDPDSVYVELEPLEYRTVALEPHITGSTGDSHTVVDTRVDPDTITVRGPRSRIEDLSAVPTERVDITDLTQSLQRQVRPRIDDGLITADVDQPITVYVDIETEEVTETLTELAVEAVNTGYDATVEPADADVTVRGPASVIEQLDTALIRLEIDLSDHSPGTYSRDASVVNLPPDVQVEHVHPQRFRVIVEPADDTADESDGRDLDDADL